ncbi:DJ-1/PfpI family protein [Thozetella sp. PMI_491]|nr:DJ-1/PfpI family protein [Thozetella sp. PMI_491]
MAPLNVGALVYDYQAIDVVAITDLLGSGSKQLAQLLKVYGPVEDGLLESTPEFNFHHIGITRDPAPLTGGVVIVPTCTLEDAPELDILILGGPSPAHFTLNPKYAEYIRKHVAADKLLFTNCTGAYVAAASGALDGRKATVNHVEYEWIKKRHPAVNWTNDTKWVVDGNIWTASGAIAGMDMVSHWLRETYGMDVLTMAGMSLEYEPRNIHGVLDVIPRRYDASGKQISTHIFKYYDSY